ncbi:carbohydrate sulfotransferase 1-like [Ylistrum balloti]|uniref:carbohydrate sulfotransferase 1-like n=1 Tax=Ylistrum balloti TaxID=509963 RepID=UPI002905DE53|nr:carbohydrate sulfotransferase 1-like [Ylistrum balloti]
MIDCGKVSVAGGLFIYCVILMGLHLKIEPSYPRDSSHVTSSAPYSRQLIVLSHSRSGSSLTGDVIQQDVQSFYVFEPLHALESMLSNNMTSMQLLNGDTVKITHDTFIARSLAVLEAYMTCNFRSLDYRTLTDGLQWMSHKHASFLTCVDKESNNKIPREQAAAKCLRILELACQTSRFIVIKTVRITMADLSGLMETYPSLHVLHLVRDPRAVLYSKSKFGVNLNENTHSIAKFECESTTRDIDTAERFRTKFHNRMNSLYYETLAARPLETSERLYKIYGLSYTERIRYHIDSITRAGRKTGCSVFNGLCLESRNSSGNIYTWKRQLSRRIVNIIDINCKGLYNKTNHFYKSMTLKRN